MPRFTSVSVYPTTVMWGAAWADDPDEDAFIRLARGICEAYSDAVAGAGIQHSVSSLVMRTEDEPRLRRGMVDHGQTVVASPLEPDPVREFFEMAAVRVVGGFATLELAQQRQLVADAVHAAGLGLAQYRGLPVEPFEDARSAVSDAGPELAWSTAWTTSPEGRWRARCNFRTMPDGFGRQVLEVSTADGASSVYSPERVASAGLHDQRRAGTSLRWKRGGRVEVSLCTEYRGPGIGVISLQPTPGIDGELTAPGAFQTLAAAALPDAEQPITPPSRVTAQPIAVAPRLDVVLVLPDPERREVHGVYASGSDRVPEDYRNALMAYFGQFEGDAWREWWSPAEVPELQVWFHTDDVKAEKLSVRRGKNKVTARIERRLESFSNGPGEGASVARQDIEGLLALVQERMRLDQPPALSHPGPSR